jgi:hypothetical protein
LALMASLLDPCMKGGVGISPEDQDAIYGEMRNQMGMIAREGIAIEGEVVVLEGNNEIHGEQEQEPARQNQDDFDIFDEIHQLYLDRYHLEMQGDHNQRDHIMENIIDAELTLYRQEAPLPMKDKSGNYNNSLFWWNLNERKFKHLSILASRILCIPATSAPLERIFLTAGLNIAKDRAHLASNTANELIFLHDVLPANRKFERGPGAE